jgi:peroxiredoxin
MRISKIVLPVLLIGGIIAIFAILNTNLGSMHSVPVEKIPEGTSIGQRAPNFQGQTLDGEIVRLSDLKGEMVVLNEFASWCAPCLLETPYLVAASRSNPDGVVFVGLNVLENSSAISNYKDEFQVPYPLVLDPQGEITSVYKPVGIPTSWFIDAEGIIRYVHSGPMTGEMIQQILDSIRSGNSIRGM